MSLVSSTRTRQGGIAIISVLVILVAVLALGTGAFLLTQVNLGIVSNVRTNVLARTYAESGLDAAQIALEEHFAAEVEATGIGDLPSSAGFSIPSISAPGFTPDFSLVDYTRVSSSVAIVVVRGNGPRNAEHVSEAVILAFPGEPQFPPFFKYGLSSMGVITTTGTSSYINAGIHGNLGYDLGSRDSFAICTLRNDDGSCARSEEIPLSDAPISAAAGWETCSPASLCDSEGGPLAITDEVTVTTGYTRKRDIALFNASSPSATSEASVVFEGFNETSGALEPVDCDVRETDPGEIDWDTSAGLTICVESNTTVSVPRNVNLENVSLLARGDVVLGSDVSLSDSLIVSTEGQVASASNGNADVSVADSKVFSESGTTFNGNGTAISGTTTLASAGSVTINGGAPAVTGVGGEASVGLVVLANGNVTVNGNSDWYVAVITEGTFTQNGTSVLVGRVAAVGDITLNGGVDLDSGLEIVNEDVDEPGAPFTEAVSRR